MTPKRKDNSQEVDWGHYEWYSSTYGSASRDNDGSEWVARVKLPDGREARIKEKFASANVAMAAVIRTWERENKKEVKA